MQHHKIGACLSSCLFNDATHQLRSFISFIAVVTVNATTVSDAQQRCHSYVRVSLMIDEWYECGEFVDWYW